MAWWSRKSKQPERDIGTLEDYAAYLNEFAFNGNSYALTGYGQQTMSGSPYERIGNDLQAYATQAYASNGAVFACMAVRMLVFSAIEFKYQNRATRDLFGTADVSILEEPWVGGTTQDLLVRMIQDADLAGNSYWTSVLGDGELVRLRPDWVTIALEPRYFRGGVAGYRKIGYGYHEGGIGVCKTPIPFLRSEVAHFAPHPDPLATYRGMSWLTPVCREIQADHQMNHHKQKFFENAATPNMVASLPETMGLEDFKKFMDSFNASHQGVRNAYKTLFLGGGADVTVVGNNMEQMSFKTIQGHGETRIAAAAGVPPIIVGLSEGLQAATYSNYAQARRRLADGTMHPLWQNAAGSLSPIIKQQKGARIWYDARHVPFLREDERDAAEIQKIKAGSVRQLVDAGYKPDTVKAAVDTEDIMKLEHSGLFSVQLQPPGTTAKPNTATGDAPAPKQVAPPKKVTGGGAP